MKIDVEEINPCRKRLKIAFSAEDVAAEYDAVLREFTRHARIKGFRPGKAPVHVVRMRHARDINRETAERLVPRGYREGLKQADLNPVAVLDVSEAAFAPGQPFTCEITCDVAPTVTLPPYTGIEVENRIEPVQDREIDETLDTIREQFATFEDVDRPVADGDLVQVDFTGTVDGAPVTDLEPEARGLDRAEDFWILVGEGSFLPEFGEGLAGATVGETRAITVRFPDDFHAEGLRGRKADYQVTVKAVREKILGELDEEKLKPFGVDTVDALRARIADDLEQRNEQRMRQDFRNQLIEHLVARTPLDLPESVVQEETRQTIYELVSNITRGGASEAQVRDHKDQIFDHATRTAADKVKVRYLLAAIAAREGIEAGDDEVEDRIRAMAVRHQATPEQVRDTLVRNNQLENLRQDLRFEKTLDFLMEQATVKDA